MELNDFIENFANQFDDTDAEMFTPETKFRDLDEWSSLTNLSIIAFVKTAYGKTVTANEIRSCDTVRDLFNLVAAK